MNMKHVKHLKCTMKDGDTQKYKSVRTREKSWKYRTTKSKPIFNNYYFTCDTFAPHY